MLYKSTLPLAVMLVFASNRPVRCQTTTSPQPVDNPVFVAWSHNKLGFRATYEGDIEGPEQSKLHVKNEIQLKELTTDAARLESTVINEDGETKTDTVMISSKIPASDVERRADEQISAMGKKFKCEVYKVSLSAVVGGNSDGSTALIYISSQIPFGVIQISISRPGMKDFTELIVSVKSK